MSFYCHKYRNQYIVSYYLFKYKFNRNTEYVLYGMLLIDTACDSGQFFNSTSLLCQKCEPGSYSLGGGIRIDSFNGTSLPSGFHINTETTQPSATCAGIKSH